jgi:hypothetical protein
MGKNTIIVILAAAVTVFASSETKIAIAVNDLVGQGVDASTAAVISERLRVELINTQAFRVMERAQMQTILQEQGLQESDVCNSNECIVKMGQLFGVEQMVIGTIGSVGALYTISLRMVNVATGEALYTASEDCRCSIEEVLVNATKNIAMKLDLAIQKAIFGTLTITTEPDSANVLINNKKIGITDYSNDRFVPGTYSLTIEKPHYDPITQEITIAMNKSVNRAFKLNHTRAYQDSLKKATRNQRIRSLIVSQLILGALAAGAGGAGYYFNRELSNSMNDKETAYTTYRNGDENSDFNALWKAYQDAGKDIKKQETMRNTMYGCAGAFGVSFCVSFFF